MFIKAIGWPSLRSFHRLRWRGWRCGQRCRAPSLFPSSRSILYAGVTENLELTDIGLIELNEDPHVGIVTKTSLKIDRCQSLA
ncbi:hypothetical protein [Geobacillus jurassicus]|uniref:Uncharacterized protein n=1 Tax=Geobacillus jurassicus TaxID=235932 RepID=A0ABV6GVX0_9BACL|nr:hypothetical protein [Geobacillus jurassicus]